MKRYTTEDIMARLAGIPPFVGLDRSTLLTLAQDSRVQTLPRDKLLFNKGDITDAAHAVLSGCIALMLRTPDGRELVIGERRAGDFFGELAALTDEHRSTDAVAIEPTELISIPTATFLKLVETNTQFARQLLSITAQRLRECSAREAALAFLDAQGRLARALLQLHSESKNGTISLPQEELAQRVGLTRQTVAKELGKWRREGWLSTGRGKINLTNIEALRAFSARFES